MVHFIRCVADKNSRKMKKKFYLEKNRKIYVWKSVEIWELPKNAKKWEYWSVYELLG